MKQILSVFFVTVSGIAAVPVHAQSASQPMPLQAAAGNPDNLKLSGSLRVRYETLGGQSRVGLNATDEQISIRSTLFAEYDSGPLRFGAELYDSRAYLGKPGSAISANDVNVAELVQAYVAADVKAPLGEGTAATLQAGRMVFNLGGRRLVAADDYRNTTTGFTGIRADLSGKDGTAFTGIYVLPQTRLPDDLPSILENRAQFDRESFATQLWGGLLSRPKTVLGALAEVGYFRFQERDEPNTATRNRNLHTASARLIRNPKAGQLDFEFEGMVQWGSVRAGTAPAAALLDVAANFVHAEAGYSFPGSAKLRLALELERASGDKPGGKFGRFDTLYGSRRTDLAPNGIYGQIGRANITAPSVRLEAAPGTKLDAFVAYRPMWLAAGQDSFSTTGVRDPSGNSGNFAGHQVEGRVRYWLVPRILRAEVNAAWIGKGRFLKEAPNAPRTGNTHYLSTALTATF